MRYHHAGHADFFNNIDQLDLRRFTQLFVQRAQWLVQQQQLRLLDQAARQGDTLLLTTGQLVRFAFGKLGQLRQFEYIIHALCDFTLRHALATQAERNVVPDIQMREQGVRLEHHIDRTIIRRDFGNIVTCEQNFARGWGFKACQHTQQGGFATAGATQQGKNFTFFNVNRDIVHGGVVAKFLDDVLYA